MRLGVVAGDISIPERVGRNGRIRARIRRLPERNAERPELTCDSAGNDIPDCSSDLIRAAEAKTA
jgi:hypothetical protein